ncbi:MAG: chorismate-binding protein, partial [Psychrobacter sp.]
TGKHHIITKPIKGTLPRGVSAKQDSALKQQLTNSEKDRAENVMIVDLLRNDLGKYARTGSVKVPQLFTIESFSNVHHMVSTITAELKENTHPLAVLFGSLPAGSITGTPKKRAVEIISELETTPRGAYCGTLGYMNFDGSGQWNVLIRTLQANALSHSDLEKEKQVSLWAGGGITIASNCDAEYQECLDKVGNLLSVL